MKNITCAKLNVPEHSIIITMQYIETMIAISYRKLIITFTWFKTVNVANFLVKLNPLCYKTMYVQYLILESHPNWGFVVTFSTYAQSQVNIIPSNYCKKVKKWWHLWLKRLHTGPIITMSLKKKDISAQAARRGVEMSALRTAKTY